jgi:predicted amidophosphoribosyltransferase
MGNIPINWRLRKQRYRLVGQKCPACNITLFYLKQVCSNCGYRFDICSDCGCSYSKGCESITDDISDAEVGC